MTDHQIITRTELHEGTLMYYDANTGDRLALGVLTVGLLAPEQPSGLMRNVYHAQGPLPICLAALASFLVANPGTYEALSGLYVMQCKQLEQQRLQGGPK